MRCIVRPWTLEDAKDYNLYSLQALVRVGAESFAGSVSGLPQSPGIDFFKIFRPTGHPCCENGYVVMVIDGMCFLELSWGPAKSSIRRLWSVISCRSGPINS